MLRPVIPPFLSGQLLLSMPGIGDPRFERAAIAMCLHDEEGALGLMVSQPGDVSVRDLLRQLDIDPGQAPDVPVLVGGPVEPQRGFVLHEVEWEGGGTVQVGNAWAFTTTLDVLHAIARGKGPRRWRACLGYTGWGAGQLDDELTRHGWHIAPGDTALVLGCPAETIWARAFGEQGINVGSLSGQAGRA
jgi:putative transcriptional regulator